MEEQSDIQKLLRLKRYERPTSGHTQEFLREFQRRQRNELLQRPLWKVVVERCQLYLRECGVANLAYAGATAGLLVFAGATLLKTSEQASPGAVAQVRNHSFTPEAHLALDNNADRFLLSPGPELLEANTVTDVSRPRYVIDARPASYEAPASF